MSFKLITKQEVLSYLEDIYPKCENEERKSNIGDLWAMISGKDVLPYFGFKNEFGERYLVVLDKNDVPHWCGDESDWGFAHSFEEDRFMYEMTEVFKAEITEDTTVNKG